MLDGIPQATPISIGGAGSPIRKDASVRRRLHFCSSRHRGLVDLDAKDVYDWGGLLPRATARSVQTRRKIGAIPRRKPERALTKGAGLLTLVIRSN